MGDQLQSRVRLCSSCNHWLERGSLVLRVLRVDVSADWDFALNFARLTFAQLHERSCVWAKDGCSSDEYRR